MSACLMSLAGLNPDVGNGQAEGLRMHSMTVFAMVVANQGARLSLNPGGGINHF